MTSFKRAACLLLIWAGLALFTTLAGHTALSGAQTAAPDPVSALIGGSYEDRVLEFFAEEAVDAPAIAVTKGANVSEAQVGQTITYTYRVTNTGDVALTDIVAGDDRLGTVSLSATSLEPGISTSGTLTYTVVAGDLPGPLTNTVVVSGTPPTGAEVAATDDESVDLVADQDLYQVYLPIVMRNFPGGADGEVLFSDDFGDPNSGWGTGETEDYTIAYTGGEYQIYAKKALGTVRALAPFDCDDCSIEVDARFAGTPNNGYGLFFARDGGDYYALIAVPYTNACDLFVFTDYVGNLLGREPCTLTGAGDHLVVEWQAPLIKTYVNGSQVHDISDGTHSGVRDIGLLTYHEGDARFDNFVVRSLP